jgi:hypothetical protein
MDKDAIAVIGVIMVAIGLIIFALPFVLGMLGVAFIWRIIIATVKTGNPIDWR